MAVVEKLVGMAGKAYRVLPNKGGSSRSGDWKVQRTGATRSYSTHNKKNTAVREGKKIAKKQNVGLVVHDSNGQVQYGFKCDTSGSRTKMVRK